jgi:hypothetical protein
MVSIDINKKRIAFHGCISARDGYVLTKQLWYGNHFLMSHPFPLTAHHLHGNTAVRVYVQNGWEFSGDLTDVTTPLPV